MKWLLGLGALLAVVLLGADRAADAFVEARIADEAVERGFTGVDAEVEGFPFLTQALDRRLAVVRLNAAGYEGPRGRLEDVRVLAREVQVRSWDEVVVDALTVDAVVPFAVVEEALGGDAGIDPVGAGAVQLTRTVEPSGGTAEISVTGDFVVDGDAIVFRAGEGAGAQLGDEARSVTIRYEVQGLPEELELRRVEAGETGFEVTLTGAGVDLSS